MKSWWQQLLAAWNRFWFLPSPPWALDIGRIVFYFAVLFRYGTKDFAFYTRLGQHIWMPHSYYQILAPHGPLPLSWALVLAPIWKISLVCSMVGLMTRFSTRIACVLGLYFTGLPINMGLAEHSHASSIIGIGLIILAFSRCGQSLSLDAWMWRDGCPSASPEFRWPVQLMRVVISLAFFGAGYNKLHASGLAWITSDTLQVYLFLAHTGPALQLVQYPFLCHLLAAFTLTVEFFHPLALLSKRCLYFFIPAGLLLLFNFNIFMGIVFYPLMMAHVFWMPWNEILSSPPRKGTSSSA